MWIFSRPLLQQLRITRADGEAIIVGLEYESQPLVYAVCGLIGHAASKCKVKPPSPPSPFSFSQVQTSAARNR